VKRPLPSAILDVMDKDARFSIATYVLV